MVRSSQAQRSGSVVLTDRQIDALPDPAWRAIGDERRTARRVSHGGVPKGLRVVLRVLLLALLAALAWWVSGG